MYYFQGTPNKKLIEEAIIQSITSNSTPTSIRLHLESLGIKADDIRSAIARLLDKGILTLDSEHILSYKSNK